jgi:hypothetical protein
MGVSSLTWYGRFFDRRWKSMTSAQVTKMATSDDTTSPSDATAALPLESSSVHESEEDGTLVWE